MLWPLDMMVGIIIDNRGGKGLETAIYLQCKIVANVCYGLLVYL